MPATPAGWFVRIGNMHKDRPYYAPRDGSLGQRLWTDKAEAARAANAWEEDGYEVHLCEATAVPVGEPSYDDLLMALEQYTGHSAPTAVRLAREAREKAGRLAAKDGEPALERVRRQEGRALRVSPVAEQRDQMDRWQRELKR